MSFIRFKESVRVNLVDRGATRFGFGWQTARTIDDRFEGGLAPAESSRGLYGFLTLTLGRPERRKYHSSVGSDLNIFLQCPYIYLHIEIHSNPFFPAAVPG